MGFAHAFDITYFIEFYFQTNRFTISLFTVTDSLSPSDVLAKVSFTTKRK